MGTVTSVLRGIATLGAGLLVVALLSILVSEGITTSRAALFGAIAIASVIGGAGTVTGNAFVAGIAGAALLLLGFWQAAIGIFVVPAGILFLTAGAAMAS